MGRAPCCDKANVKRGPWSPEEDTLLKNYLDRHGTASNWISLPQKAGLKRCGKSCRLRWLNYLRPDIKHGGFTEEEDNIICSLYISIGSRWSVIASKLQGRTDNDVKNYWNTKLKKKFTGAKLTTKNKNNTITNTLVNLCSSSLVPKASDEAENYGLLLNNHFDQNTTTLGLPVPVEYSQGLVSISNPSQYPLPRLMETSDQFSTSSNYSYSTTTTTVSSTTSQEVSVSVSVSGLLPVHHQVTSHSIAFDDYNYNLLWSSSNGSVDEDYGFLMDFGLSSSDDLLPDFGFEDYKPIEVASNSANNTLYANYIPNMNTPSSTVVTNYEYV